MPRDGAVKPDADVGVVLVDDHPATLEGLARMAQGCGSHGPRAVRRQRHSARRHRRAPAGDRPARPADGAARRRAVLAEIVRRRLSTRVIVFSMHGEAAHVRTLLKEGAKGYVTKTASPQQLAAALRAVMSGREYVAEELRAAVDRQRGRPLPRLSPRERDVLLGVEAGLKDRQIALALFISRETVRTNLRRAAAKWRFGPDRVCRDGAASGAALTTSRARAEALGRSRS